MQWLFARDQQSLTAWQTVKWWEKRRIAYNMLVGLAGVLTCAVILFIGIIVKALGREACFPDPPLFAVFGIILYGVAANICYTGGWLCEMVARQFWPAEAAAFGRLSFILGLIGSVLLTFLPAALIAILSLIELLVHRPIH